MKFLQTDMTALLGSYHFPQNPLKLKRIQAFKLTRVVAMEKSQTSRHPLSNQTTLKGRKTQHPSSFKSLSSPRSSSSIICRPPLLISLASLLFKKVKGMGRLFKGGGGGGRLMDIMTHGMGVYWGKGTYSKKYGTRI